MVNARSYFNALSIYDIRFYGVLLLHFAIFESTFDSVYLNLCNAFTYLST